MSERDILSRARERYAQGIEADEENRRLDELQRKFLRGKLEDQWDADVLQKRKGRITVVVNRCNQFVKQVTGEMRQNKPAIRVLPVDDQTDPKLAEVYSAIIRHIESQSDAHRAYAKAGEQAVIGGIGWFRVLTEYLDDKSFDQEIVIKHVRNPLSVVIDPGAVELTRHDMGWAIVSELIPESTFKARYPKAKLTGFEEQDWAEQWHSADMIRVAEYWERVPYDRELLLLTDGSTRYGEEIDEATASQLTAQGIGIANSRKAKGWRVKCRKITGVEVLETNDWAGSYIPLIPAIGEEIEVGDTVFRHGLIYPMMDSARAYNFARSAMLETVASQPKAPYLVTSTMVAKHLGAWQGMSEGNPPVLVYDPDPMVPGGPRREAPPQFSAAWYQEALTADGDMKATTGIYDASLGKQGNETSGRAIMARDQQGETASYVFVDNLSAAIRQCGRILLELIPQIYTGERVVRLMGEDGGIEGYERVNTMLPDGQMFNDISVGQFDLEVVTGPAFATKRMEAAEKMMQLVQSVPQIGQVGADMIVKGLDIPYGDKLADRLAMMLVPPGMDEDIDKKRAEMAQKSGPQQPDPMQQLAVAGAQADVENKQADTALKAAKVEQTQIATVVQSQDAHLRAFQAGAGMVR